MKAWIAKTFVTAVLVVLDSWLVGALTEERARRWRQVLESATIDRVLRLDKRPYWKKKRSNNAFAAYMAVLLKSNRLTEFEAKK